MNCTYQKWILDGRKWIFHGRCNGGHGVCMGGQGARVCGLQPKRSEVQHVTFSRPFATGAFVTATMSDGCGGALGFASSCSPTCSASQLARDAEGEDEERGEEEGGVEEFEEEETQSIKEGDDDLEGGCPADYDADPMQEETHGMGGECVQLEFQLPEMDFVAAHSASELLQALCATLFLKRFARRKLRKFWQGPSLLVCRFHDHADAPARPVQLRTPSRPHL